MSKRLSSRQKMINLMYLVFIAMLALNISTEVLKGFDIVNENLQKEIDNAFTRNNQLYGELKSSYDTNPVKVEEWYNRSLDVKTKTDSLYNYIEHLKEDLVRMSDGIAKGGEVDVKSLENKENLDAASELMLSPINGQGKKLKEAIDKYRSGIIDQIEDQNKKDLILHSLSTKPSKRAKLDNQDWQSSSFENMPSVAVVSFLTGIQAGVKDAEGEALNNLIKNVDFKDYRVNTVDAFIIPESNIVMAGTPYKAKVVLAAVDTTQRPRIVINNQELPSDKNGEYIVGTGKPGTVKYSGFLELTGRDGSITKRDFSHEYTVIEPMATISPLLMDVVYAGIANPMSIAVPGVAGKDISASATGGNLKPDGNNWVATPTGKIGEMFTINVAIKSNGATRNLTKSFRIRALPEPTPYIQYTDANGALKQFKRGALPRAVLTNVTDLKASIDDGVLNMPFTVLSFQTIFIDAMGDAIREVSDGAQFSQRQKAQFQRLVRGKSFFISSIRVKGADGIEREISAMEVRMN